MLASPQPDKIPLSVVNKINQTSQNEAFSPSRIFPEQRRDIKETVLTAQIHSILPSHTVNLSIAVLYFMYLTILPTLADTVSVSLYPF